MLVIILRVLGGMTSGAVTPSVVSLIGRWIPKYERSKVIAVVYSGDHVSSKLTSRLSHTGDAAFLSTFCFHTFVYML